jgi:hypothetical protein
MRKIFPILLIGCLSMLFAEVFSGASQTWFANGWGLLLTFPLYLGHILFFLWIALKFKKTSLSQLYCFGVIFALYESWITKVLWAGYMDSAGPGLGTLFGIGIPEFPVLVFFWHPIMSFILPILVFEVLTKKVLIGHEQILQKTSKKTIMIIIFLSLISTFIANGNQFNSFSSNLSLIGTQLLVMGLYYISRKIDLTIFIFSKIGFVILSIYLLLLYLVTFFFLSPDRIPNTVMPYISIIIIYFIALLPITKSKTTDIQLVAANKNQYSIKDLIIFALVTILSINVASLLQGISLLLLAATYCIVAIIGTMIFIVVIYRTLNKSPNKLQ